jgi:hypothetical protein
MVMVVEVIMGMDTTATMGIIIVTTMGTGMAIGGFCHI